MGFMDKAKKLAEQAQQKLDEVQQDLNKKDAPQGGEGTGQRFDEHGRPLADEPGAAQPEVPQPDAPPAGETPAPTAQPAPASPDPTAPAPPPPGADSGANASPDPFKPLDK